jgi:uncharacterized membrane protein YhiD involved in acid resistance
MYSIDLNTIVLNAIVTVVFAVFIMFAYRITYSGAAYSQRFNVTLGVLTIVTSLIMSVISSNVALSLGMVGALSIIRFRTAVKDTRDASFIFWTIAVGICCGVSQYILAGISSVIVFLFMLVFRQIGPDAKLLLIIRCDVEAQNKLEAGVVVHFGKHAHKKMKNLTPDSCEIVFEITQNALKKSNERANVDIAQRLIKIDGVRSVNMVEQSDDISR